jgi:protein-tyrosine phosphatase
MEIKDGSFPSHDIINDYLLQIKTYIKVNNVSRSGIKPCVGIHCRAGLGRAPIFAAIGLMNYTEYEDYSNIVKLIRQKIKGSINVIQLTELSKYKPKKKSNGCIIC